MTTFDHTVFFDSVRASLFDGHMSQSQVDGMEAILNGWSAKRGSDDVRWLAYFLATAYHETSQEMQPIEEYGHGGDAEYAQPDPETGQCYYGRGFVQLTWKANYQRADDEIGCDSVWHPEQQLEATIAGATGYRGMLEGWFRGDNFGMYFSPDTEDPFHARNIINGDENVIPSWSNGVSIGKLIEGYYDDFLEALNASASAEPAPESLTVAVTIVAPAGVTVLVNGKELVS